ncbi:SMI1 / KNR4 family (SUKH-1) [Collimonas sp. OK307]|uniref:SMI1/KNR4 family protein n=1 Tax=Collimonas sp. OK307 TaxID=1801620 RepID=UPI0008F35F11|nr:SMI1/KNR4 family protein [Collimonas sp. OK307]SFI16956.1 SMI1 / KNR4 family (SUKH-1) [Collimonas sp. OK307]
MSVHRAKPLSDAYLVNNPDYWGIRVLFEIGDVAAYDQVDHVFEAVGDVLPTGMFPVADDSSGNLYLIDVAQGARVIWWSHERERTDNRVDEVATSFSEFLTLVREN